MARCVFLDNERETVRLALANPTFWFRGGFEVTFVAIGLEGDG
jgi:hypothetical protein